MLVFCCTRSGGGLVWIFKSCTPLLLTPGDRLGELDALDRSSPPPQFSLAAQLLRKVGLVVPDCKTE